MRIRCRKCHSRLYHPLASVAPGVECKCGGLGEVSPTPYQLMRFERNPHPSVSRRLTHPDRCCAVCGLEIKTGWRHWVHLVAGGAALVRRDESTELSRDKDQEAGDMGLHEVGSDCAKRFPPEYVIEWTTDTAGVR